MSKSKDVVKRIRKATRRKFSAEENIRIVLERLRAKSQYRSCVVAGDNPYHLFPDSCCIPPRNLIDT